MSPWILLTFDVIAACLAVGGITLIVRSLATRHLSFAARVAQGRVQEDTTPEITRWLRRMGASALDSLGSTSESVARRLILAGAAPEVSVFRLRQAAAAIAGLIGACLVLTARPAASLRASVIPLIVCALVGTLLGVAGMDRYLTLTANRRQRAIDAAVPDCSELLALAVAAGESIPAAIERVAGCAGGPLGMELGLTAGHIRNGMPSVRALAEMVDRTDSPALTRLARTLTTAIERGSPLASVLHDQARDQRERSLAALMARDCDASARRLPHFAGHCHLCPLSGPHRPGFHPVNEADTKGTHAMKKWLRKPQPLGERGDVPGWVLITLMTAALVVVIWGVASDRLVEIFNRAMDSVAGI